MGLESTVCPPHKSGSIIEHCYILWSLIAHSLPPVMQSICHGCMVCPFCGSQSLLSCSLVLLLLPGLRQESLETPKPSPGLQPQRGRSLGLLLVHADQLTSLPVCHPPTHTCSRAQGLSMVKGPNRGPMAVLSTAQSPPAPAVGLFQD